MPEPQTCQFPVELFEDIGRESVERGRSFLADHFVLSNGKLELKLSTTWSPGAGYKVAYEWRLVRETGEDMVSRAEMRRDDIRRQLVPLPQDWRQFSNLPPKRKVFKANVQRNPPLPLPERLSKFAALMSMRSHVEKELERTCSYKLPFIGEYKCSFVGPSHGETCLRYKGKVDMRSDFHYTREGEHPCTIRAFDIQTRNERYCWPSLPLNFAQCIVSAFCAALLTERLPMPWNRTAKAARFMRVAPADSVVVILAIGYPKPLLAVPEVKTLVDIPVAKDPETQRKNGARRSLRARKIISSWRTCAMGNTSRIRAQKRKLRGSIQQRPIRSLSDTTT